jgi:hypothetical protein
LNSSVRSERIRQTSSAIAEKWGINSEDSQPLWPFFLNPAANGNPPLFRLRSFVRYTLNALRGEVKP